jgi:His/Glu/Gln/Arg/opine family amino acid ABC transporter permease subunit
MGVLYGLAEAIYSNLIREDRYMLMVKGLGTTLQITVYALLMGIAIGLVVAMLRVMKVKGLDKVAELYVHIIRGTPAVVQLVIIYYAILGSVSMPKVLVASVAFAINSGAYVSELIRGGILAVDRGQMEAARSLGLSWAQAMRHVVMPQAIKNILPALVNESIMLLKETAIAGYIALDDLTRSGNIIRSRTFDAYTPFLLVAVVYLYTTTILTIFANKLEKRMRRSD